MYACARSDGCNGRHMGQRVAQGRVLPAYGACTATHRCTIRAQAWGLITCRWHPLTRETRQGLRHQPLPAKDGEVACGVHLFVGLRHGFPGAVMETRLIVRKTEDTHPLRHVSMSCGLREDAVALCASDIV